MSQAPLYPPLGNSQDPTTQGYQATNVQPQQPQQQPLLQPPGPAQTPMQQPGPSNQTTGTLTIKLIRNVAFSIVFCNILGRFVSYVERGNV